MLIYPKIQLYALISVMHRVTAAVSDYAAGKKWYLYLPVWIGCAFIMSKIVAFSPDKEIGVVLLPMSMLYFGLHELAHAFTMGLPSIITAASGSISEIIFGGLLVFAAIRTRYYFAAVYCSLWLAFAFKDAGIYMSDARAQNLMLFSPFGDTAIHDWNFVFEKLGILQADRLIGGVSIGLGYIVGATALAGGIWIMILSAGSQDDAAKKAHAVALAARLRSSHGYDSPQAVRQAGQKDAVPARPDPASLYPAASRGTLAFTNEPADTKTDETQKLGDAT